MKKIKQSKNMQTIVELMMDHNATAEQIKEVEIRLFVIVFGEKQSDSLNTLRYAKYMEMLAPAKNIDPQKLSNSKSSTLSQLACTSASHSLEGTYY